jgi:DNA repair exonuclease SbcCD ATPase subunit
MKGFNPLELTLTGFGSFRNKQSFKFPQEPGLYFMRGENRLEPRLGANGAGKSTIWKALCWVLWGKTANGLKAGDVSTWGVQKGTEVILDFEWDADGTWMSYSIRRTWKPNTWILFNGMDGEARATDLTKDETNPVLGMLRVQFEPFLHSIYLAQRADMFLDLKPEPKAQLFSSVMDLDRWLGYSADASTRASDQDRITRRLESELAELKGRLEATDFGDLQAEADAFEGDRRDKLEQITLEHAKIMRLAKAAKQNLEDADEAEALAFSESKGLVEKRDAAFDRREAALKKLRHSEDRVLGLSRDLTHATEHYERILDREGCPTCGVKPGKSDQARLEDEAGRILEKVGAELRLAEGFEKGLRQALEDAEDDLKRLEAEHQRVIDRRTQASERVRSARIAHQTEEKRLDALEDEAARVEAAKNPFQAMMQERGQRLNQVREEFERVQAQLNRSCEKHALYSFWVRGFKEVRLQQISEALDELEIEANSELMEFGLIGWELRFDVDAETKSGKLSRGFSVSVLSPHNAERVPWESWSGGESQRLRLAAQCGLANLIRSRTGCSMPLEVWDEPTEGLSEEGINDLLAALSQRAAREQRTIWVVDHRALGYGGFAGTVTIVRDERGSRVVQSTV